jgi:hypothetical protein
MTNTDLFGDEICFIPLGTCPFQPGPVMRYSPACVPVVRGPPWQTRPPNWRRRASVPLIGEPGGASAVSI